MEQAFINQALSESNPTQTLHILADWWEEQGDPRANPTRTWVAGYQQGAEDDYGESLGLTDAFGDAGISGDVIGLYHAISVQQPVLNKMAIVQIAWRDAHLLRQWKPAEPFEQSLVKAWSVLEQGFQQGDLGAVLWRVGKIPKASGRGIKRDCKELAGGTLVNVGRWRAWRNYSDAMSNEIREFDGFHGSGFAHRVLASYYMFGCYVSPERIEKYISQED